MDHAITLGEVIKTALIIGGVGVVVIIIGVIANAIGNSFKD